MYQRLLYKKILEKIEGPRTFIQALSGPRQVGKSTLIHQIKKSLSSPSHYAAAAGAFLHGSSLIRRF